MEKNNVKTFIRACAICSLLGALTTALLIFLPSPVATDPEAKAHLSNNLLYLTKLWILFIHPQVNLIASIGIAYLLLKRYPGLMIIGSLLLFIWAYTEISQQALLIDALNQIWRPAYLAATDPESQQAYLNLEKVAGGISDSKYFVVIYAFGIGSLLFGWAMKGLNDLGKWIGYSLIFIGLLSLGSFGRYYLGQDWLNPFVDFCYQYIYGYLQPLVRVLIAYWLWRQSQRSII